MKFGGLLSLLYRKTIFLGPFICGTFRGASYIYIMVGMYGWFRLTRLLLAIPLWQYTKPGSLGNVPLLLDAYKVSRGNIYISRNPSVHDKLSGVNRQHLIALPAPLLPGRTCYRSIAGSTAEPPEAALMM